MSVAIIPARGGSKRIPRKNVKLFCGKPVIAWSIAAAQESGCFDRVIVSTDDSEIAEISRAHGAETPFLRPQSLADDETGTIPVVRHAVDWLTQHDRAPEFVCCIYATAPFISAQDIRAGRSLLLDSGADYVFPVTTYPFPIQRAVRVREGGRVEMFWPEHFNTRSQDLEDAFHDAGQFYWGRASAWKAGARIFGPNAASIRIPRYRAQDIDTPEDWRTAEYMFRAIALENAPS